jgi:hypothetical protein
VIFDKFKIPLPAIFLANCRKTDPSPRNFLKQFQAKKSLSKTFYRSVLLIEKLPAGNRFRLRIENIHQWAFFVLFLI